MAFTVNLPLRLWSFLFVCVHVCAPVGVRGGYLWVCVCMYFMPICLSVCLSVNLSVDLRNWGTWETVPPFITYRTMAMLTGCFSKPIFKHLN